MNQRAAAEAALAALAAQTGAALDVAEAALLLASLDRPRVPLERYREHLATLAREVGALVPAGAAHNIRRRADALAAVIARRFGYGGDTLTYDDPQNANLMRVIDRRKGLPVSLGIIYVQTARALGWPAAGLNFPTHFMVRLDCGGDRIILDPFHGGVVRSAFELRALLKANTGAHAELQPAHTRTVADRDVLLRLQNNIKFRALAAGRTRRASEVIGRMLLFAPDRAALWHEAGICHARLGELAAAGAALEQFVARCDDDDERHQAAALLQRLRARLN